MQRLFLAVVLTVPLLFLAIQAQAQSNGSEYYKKGMEQNKAGRYREAISAFSTAISLDDKDSSAYSGRGGAWFMLKEYDKAIADFNQAIALNPRNLFARMTRGLAWSLKGEGDKAIADYSQALAINPNLAFVYTDRGTLLEKKGEFDKALKDYNEAIRLNPKDAGRAYNNVASLQATCPDQRIRDGQKAVHNANKAYQLSAGKAWQTLSTLAAAFAESRRHDPLQFTAYQGSDPEVIQGCLAIVKKVTPAWQALREKGITRDAEYRALKDLSEGLREAGVHDLAIFARQLMAARRNSYDAEDYPIIAAGLRKLAPGEKIEEILARLRGGKGKEALAFRPLTRQENEKGQPALGSGLRLYMPDKPPPKTEANKPVHMDNIRLLTSEDDIAKRTTVEDFGKLIKEFDKIADEVLGKCQTPCTVLVQFTCAPSGHTVKIMHKPKEVDEKPLKELYDTIAKMDKLAVKEETVEFQIQLTVTPKNKLPNK